MLFRPVIYSGVAALLFATSVAAQPAGTWELGAFTRYTDFGDAIMHRHYYNGGGRIGYFPISRLELEGSAAFGSTEQTVPPARPLAYKSLQARVIYNQPLTGFLSFLVGAGYLHNLYTSSDTLYGDPGMTSLFGLRVGTGRLALRVAGTADYLPRYHEGGNSFGDAVNLGFEAGLSVFLGSLTRGRSTGFDVRQAQPAGDPAPVAAPPPPPPPADADGDGVPDGPDRCPGTPAGTEVGPAGCPLPPAAEPQPAVEEVPEPDADGDGVPDRVDRCPRTAAGAEVNAEGCVPIRDSDGDGVVDRDDRCPGTPPGTEVNAAGCVPITDRDGDGVVDGADRCPDTRAGTEVNAEGCPLGLDGDGDGVTDANDKCLATPRGARVDAVGCTVLFEGDETGIILEGVTFRPGTWDLTPEARRILDGVAQALLANPSIRVEIAGYSDNTGEQRRNIWLSQTRADAVKLYLRRQGVPRDRMRTKGYGPADPVASNDTSQGRARNRRIELHRLP